MVPGSGRGGPLGGQRGDVQILTFTYLGLVHSPGLYPTCKGDVIFFFFFSLHGFQKVLCKNCIDALIRERASEQEAGLAASVKGLSSTFQSFKSLKVFNFLLIPHLNPKVQPLHKHRALHLPNRLPLPQQMDLLGPPERSLGKSG